MLAVAAAIIRKDDFILLTRRGPDGHLPGLWEFPGGKVEAGESFPDALRREIREELGVEIEVFGEFYTTTHMYPEKSVDLHFFECEITQGEPSALDVAEWRWVKTAELREYEFPEADLELVDRLARLAPPS